MFLWGKRWSARPPPWTLPRGLWSRRSPTPPPSRSAFSPYLQPIADPSSSLLWQTFCFLHNISTPLSTLASLIDTLAPTLPARQAKLLQTTMNTLLHATHLQTTSLRGQVSPKPVNLSQATRSLTPLLKQLCAPYEFSVRLPSRAVWVAGDEAAWEQILMNLAKNSHQALHRQTYSTGQIFLSLSSQRGRCQVEWWDTGGGVTAAHWLTAQHHFSQNWTAQTHGFGLPYCHYWWTQSFSGSIRLHRWPHWKLVFTTALLC